MLRDGRREIPVSERAHRVPVVISGGVPEEAAARKALAFESVRRRLVAGRAGRHVVTLWGLAAAALILSRLAGAPGVAAAFALAIAGAMWLERRWIVAVIRGALPEALAEISQGRLPEAEGALAALDEAFAVPRSFARNIRIHQAMIATRRGDLALARTRLDEALGIAVAPGDAEGAQDAQNATALRALVLASCGEVALAEADIHAVRARDASDEALARVSLAHALLLQRGGERDLLRGLLEDDGNLMREALHPRERAIVRALVRWLRAPRVTPYRHAEVPPPSEEPSVETWVERIAPDLAAFVDVGARIPLGPSPLAPNLTAAAPTHAGFRAIRDARRARGSSVWPLLAIAFGAFGATALVVLSRPEALSATAATELHGGSQTAGLLGAFALLIGGLVMWAGRDGRRKRERQRLGVIEHRARASTRAAPELATLTESGDARTAAQAALAMAEAAERRGRWPEVLARTEKGLQRVAKRKDAELLVGELVSLRAFALAVCDRQGEAEAELATIARGFPHGPRALLRVRLVEAIRRGRLGDARDHVERHAADLPLSVREEALADMVRAVHRGEGGAGTDAARLAAELAQDTHLRSWLQGVAPALLARFEGGDGADLVDRRTRIAGACSEGGTNSGEGRDVEAVEEARVVESLAEQECHHGSSSASTARLTS